MNKFLLFAFLSICCGSFAQKVVVTPLGIVSESDSEKDYIVIEVPDKTAGELYNNALAYIQKNYKNPSEVLKAKVENDYIRFDTHADRVFYLNAGLGTKNWGDINYTTQLDFKDGKIKISFPVIDLKPDAIEAQYDIGWKSEGMMNPGLYDKKGKLKQEEAKVAIELYFNTIILDIKSSVGNTQKKEEW